MSSNSEIIEIELFRFFAHPCAAAESFFATIKAEIGTDSWPDRTSARRDTENWITAYNQRRLRRAGSA